MESITATDAKIRDPFICYCTGSSAYRLMLITALFYALK